MDLGRRTEQLTPRMQSSRHANHERGTPGPFRRPGVRHLDVCRSGDEEVLRLAVLAEHVHPVTCARVADGGDRPEDESTGNLALRGVVSKRGTAAEAAVPGFTISGKTGTAQKAAPGGGYEKNKYVVSFSGYLPADHPEFVGLVVLDDAHTSKPELNYGGLVSGPIFSQIAEKAARYLDLQPHEEIRKALPVERVALTNASHH